MITRRTLLAGGLGLGASGVLAGCSGRPRPATSSPISTPRATVTGRPVPVGALAGVGTWEGANQHVAANLAESGARWYYTWSPTHTGIVTPPGCEFVPMIRGASDLTDSSLRAATKNGKVLMGFNEPDLPEQANMSVEAALDAWPRLEATGLPLGAPSCASRDEENGWLAQFISGSNARDYRVDFIPLHWYPPDAIRLNYSTAAAVQDLQNYLEAVHARYGLPVWLTEFSLVTFQVRDALTLPPETQTEFLAAAVAMMRSLPYLQRWSWFSLTPYASPHLYPTYDASDTALFAEDGQITVVGQQFRSLA